MHTKSQPILLATGLCLLTMAASAQYTHAGSGDAAPIAIGNADAFDWFLVKTSESRYQFSPEPEGFNVNSAAFQSFLENPDLWPPGMEEIQIANATFEGSLDLSDLNCPLSIELENCLALEGIQLDRSTWTGNVSLTSCTVSSLSAVSTQFNRGLSLRGVHCLGDINLNGSVHGALFSLFDVDIDGELLLREAALNSGARWQRFRCAGDVTAEGAAINQLLLEISEFEQVLDLSGAVVSGTIQFEIVSVATLLNMRGMQAGNVNVARGELGSLDASGATIGEELVILDWSASTMSTKWLSDAASLDLSNARIGNFVLPQMGLPPVIDLRGLTYTSFTPECVNCDSDSEVAAFILYRLNLQQPPSDAVVTGLVDHLRSHDETQLANALEYAVRESARREPGLSFMRRAWMQVDRITTGHGLYMHRLLWWFAGWFATYALLAIVLTKGQEGSRARLVSALKGIVVRTGARSSAMALLIATYRVIGLALFAIAIYAFWRRTNGPPAAFLDQSLNSTEMLRHFPW